VFQSTHVFTPNPSRGDIATGGIYVYAGAKVGIEGEIVCNSCSSNCDCLLDTGRRSQRRILSRIASCNGDMDPIVGDLESLQMRFALERKLHKESKCTFFVASSRARLAAPPSDIDRTDGLPVTLASF